DLLILDVMLPDLDGFEVTRRLRADGIRVPVLFLTARDATEDKVTGLTVGGDDYVTKPFSLEELVARVRAILRRTSPADGDGPLRPAVRGAVGPDRSDRERSQPPLGREPGGGPPGPDPAWWRLRGARGDGSAVPLRGAAR